MSRSEGFATFLAPRLAVGTSLTLYHTSTQPAPCAPLYSPGPGQVEEQTWCESHFLTLAQHAIQDVGSHATQIVLGVEVQIFTTDKLTTIFVAKADSTGLLRRQPGVQHSASIAYIVLSSFLEFLLQPRRGGPRVVVSLFARSQNQYLFPGSIENASKRILDDRQLIKWWCRVLDPLVRAQWTTNRSTATGAAKAYIVVPGCDKYEARAFLPPSVKLDPPADPKWIVGYPVDLLSSDTSLPLACLIPRLPDDPKARFLEDLDGGPVNADGSWKGVTSLDQFWEMMSYRQECAAGRLVGFIWMISVDGNQPILEVEQTKRRPQPGTSTESTNADNDSPKTVTPHQAVDDVVVMPTTTTINESGSAQVKSSASILASSSTSDTAAALSWPASTRGQFILSSKAYTLLMDFLLQLDFAGEDTAQQSTKEWINKAQDLAATASFGVDVSGSLSVPELQSTPTHSDAPVNILTAVRKKRKANPVEAEEPKSSTAVNVLSMNLVRKKPKG